MMLVLGMNQLRAVITLALAVITSPQRAADTAAAGEVVSALYKSHFSLEQRWDLTIKRERARFAAPLMKLLDEDMAASEATPGEIVGLDYNPLTSSQEEADGYKVGTPRLEKGEAVVPVEVRIGKDRSTLTIRLVSVEGRWRISNIRDRNGDLVTMLRKLKAERAKPVL
jgi:hypothetical protein